MRRFGVLALAFASLVVGAPFAVASRRHSHRRRTIDRALPVASATPVATTVPPLAPGPRLRITFVSVGQGDGALLESGDGHAALIDAGPPEGYPHLQSVLDAHRIRALDWVMFSHPHLDHIGAGHHVLDHYRVARVIDPAFPHPIVTYDRLLERVQQLGIPFTAARAHDSLALGDHVRVNVLLPVEPFLAHTRSDANSNSVVAMVQTGQVRVLFTGDSERETEERLIEREHGNLRADVLKVAHHGSRFATTSALLDEVSPRIAVISCGASNDYGHPHAPTLQALAARRIETHRTDLEGDVVVETDGTTIAAMP